MEEEVIRSVIVYESHFGNTKTIAEAIAAELEAAGHEVELRNVRDRHPESPCADIIFLGSPVRMGSVSGRVKRFLGKLDVDAWKGKPIVVFTTTLKLPENATDAQRQSQEKYDRSAGRKLGELAKSAGLDAVEKLLWVEVTGLKGPLVETGIESARLFTRDILRTLRLPHLR
jgi:menaquinone-dependent protoporphyrinogen IX oxidase